MKTNKVVFLANVHRSCFICFAVVIVLFLQTACAQEAKQEPFTRRPFQKSQHVIKQPEYVDRTEEYGDKYKPNPRVVETSQKEGKYELRWKGFDGKERVIAYQRADAIEASVKKEAKDTFIYTYKINVLPDSPIYFRNVIVQTFSKDFQALDVDRDRFGFFYNG